MTVQVPVRADVHDDVVDVRAPAEFPQQIVAPRAGAERDLDYFAALRLAPAERQFVELAEWPVTDRVEQGSGNLRGGVGRA